MKKVHSYTNYLNSYNLKQRFLNTKESLFKYRTNNICTMYSIIYTVNKHNGHAHATIARNTQHVSLKTFPFKRSVKITYPNKIFQSYRTLNSPTPLTKCAGAPPIATIVQLYVIKTAFRGPNCHIQL